MTKTRNLSDLLDANGDVKLGNLDNVPASNDASALTTGTLPIARIADGDIATAKLSDSSVTTAKLNDASVSLAKLTATGTKDATTFLRGDNTFAEAGGGAWSKLTTTTVSSNVSEVVFNSTYLTSTYRDYRIIISDMHHTTGAGAYPELQIGNGSTYITNGDYRFAMRAWKSDASTNQEVSQATSQFKLSADSIAGDDVTKLSSFEITMFDPLSTGSYFTLQATGSFIASNDLACGQYGGGFFNGQQGTAINLVKIFMNTGSINKGTFTLYGRKI